MPLVLIRGTVTCRHIRPHAGGFYGAGVAVLFMSGIILTIVGSGRAVVLSRVGRVVVADDEGTQPIPMRLRPDVSTLLWLAVAAYGLFLASAGIILGR